MATTARFYGLFFKSLCNKEIDLDSDTIKLMLTTSTYNPSQDTHQYKSSVTNEVASGNGYTTGGVALASVTVSYDAGTNVLSFDSTTNPSWTAASFTTRYGVLYDSTPATDATRPLIGYLDFGADQTVTNGTFTVTWDAAGIGAVTVA